MGRSGARARELRERPVNEHDHVYAMIYFRVRGGVVRGMEGMTERMVEGMVVRMESGARVGSRGLKQGSLDAPHVIAAPCIKHKNGQ